VLVEVQAATINASDFLYISGRYFITPQPPADVGAEGYRAPSGDTFRRLKLQR
jgi:NADPH:quinone reductase-like Zn-dependent oxidoreductase